MGIIIFLLIAILIVLIYMAYMLYQYLHIIASNQKDGYEAIYRKICKMKGGE